MVYLPGATRTDHQTPLSPHPRASSHSRALGCGPLHARPQGCSTASPTSNQAPIPREALGDGGYATKKAWGHTEGTGEGMQPVRTRFFGFSPSPYPFCLSAVLRRSRRGGAILFQSGYVIYALICNSFPLDVCWASRSVRASQQSRVWRIPASCDSECNWR